MKEYAHPAFNGIMRRKTLLKSEASKYAFRPPGPCVSQLKNAKAMMMTRDIWKTYRSFCLTFDSCLDAKERIIGEIKIVTGSIKRAKEPVINR